MSDVLLSVQARQTLVEVDGVLQPAPAPRFSRTPAALTAPDTWQVEIDDLLQRWDAPR